MPRTNVRGRRGVPCLGLGGVNHALGGKARLNLVLAARLKPAEARDSWNGPAWQRKLEFRIEHIDMQ